MSEHGPSSPETPQPIEGTPQDGWTAPAYSAPSYGQQPGYGSGTYPGATQPMPGQAPPLGRPLQDDSGATPALVVGIVAIALGLLGAGLGFVISPVAMVLGWRSKRRIDASNGQLGGRGNAQAGFILGLIGTIFLALGIVLLLLIVGLIFSHDSSGTF